MEDNVSIVNKHPRLHYIKNQKERHRNKNIVMYYAHFMLKLVENL